MQYNDIRSTKNKYNQYNILEKSMGNPLLQLIFREEWRKFIRDMFDLQVIIYLAPLQLELDYNILMGSIPIIETSYSKYNYIQKKYVMRKTRQQVRLLHFLLVIMVDVNRHSLCGLKKRNTSSIEERQKYLIIGIGSQLRRRSYEEV